jgi:acetylglutamate kinase
MVLPYKAPMGAMQGVIPAMSTTFSMTSEDNVTNNHQLIAQVLHEALPYIDFLKGKTLVIKLGGSTLTHQKYVLQDIVLLRSLGAYPVLVHGGGPYINEWLKKLNVPSHFEDGLRVTDAGTLDIVRMVLLGQVNQSLVAALSEMGGRAVGVNGTDGNMIQARIADEKLGFVGAIESVDAGLLQLLIEQGYIPVVAPLGRGPDHPCLNINADLVAAHIAGAMHAEKLIFLSNVTGICRADGSLISELNRTEAQQLIADGTIHGGMIPKVAACLDALSTVSRVHIVDGREPHTLLRELFTDQGAGTMIIRETS